VKSNISAKCILFFNLEAEIEHAPGSEHDFSEKQHGHIDLLQSHK
jgi:hypothetical protein